MTVTEGYSGKSKKVVTKREHIKQPLFEMRRKFNLLVLVPVYNSS
jgi:hypothetical protein